MLFVFPALVSPSVDESVGSMVLKSIEFYYLNRIVESIMSDYLHFSVIYNDFLGTYSQVMLESTDVVPVSKSDDVNPNSIIKKAFVSTATQAMSDIIQQQYFPFTRSAGKDRYSILGSSEYYKYYFDLRPSTILLSAPIKVYKQTLPLSPLTIPQEHLSSIRDIPISVKIIPIHINKDFTKKVLLDVTQSIFTNPLSKVIDKMLQTLQQKLRILMHPILNMLKIRDDEDQEGFNLYLDILSNDQLIVNNRKNIRTKKILLSDKYLDLFSGILLFNKVDIEQHKDFVFSPQFNNRVFNNGWLSIGVVDELSNIFYFVSRFLSNATIVTKVSLDVLAHSLDVKDIFDDYKKLSSVVKRMIGVPHQQSASSLGSSLFGSN